MLKGTVVKLIMACGSQAQIHVRKTPIVTQYGVLVVRPYRRAQRKGLVGLYLSPMVFRFFLVGCYYLKIFGPVQVVKHEQKGSIKKRERKRG